MRDSNAQVSPLAPFVQPTARPSVPQEGYSPLRFYSWTYSSSKDALTANCPPILSSVATILFLTDGSVVQATDSDLRLSVLCSTEEAKPTMECQTLATPVGFLYCGEPASSEHSPVIQLTDNDSPRVDSRASTSIMQVGMSPQRACQRDETDSILAKHLRASHLISQKLKHPRVLNAYPTWKGRSWSNPTA